MRKRGFFSQIIFGMALVAMGGCSRCSRTQQPEAPGPRDALVVTNTPATPAPAVAGKVVGQRDRDLERVVKIALQGDQIMREALWVVTDEKRAAPRSAFGKLQRAALMAMDGKLSSKGLFNCDRYTFKKTELSPGNLLIEFSENCKGGAEPIASWRKHEAQAADIDFVPTHLQEVLGINASLFAKKLHCRVTWSENGTVDTLSCPGWEQDRGSQLMRFSVFEYQRDQQNLMTMKGEIVENLLPVRKINARVPLAGKISVEEQELRAPPPDPAAPPAAPVAPPPAKPPVADPNAAPTDEENAGEVPMQRQSVRPEAPPSATPAPAIDPDAPVENAPAPQTGPAPLAEPEYINEGAPGTGPQQIGPDGVAPEGPAPIPPSEPAATAPYSR